MFQARENLALDVKSRQLSYRLLPQQLDRDPLLEVAFSPLRLIHNAHSAPADPSGNPPGTDTGAWRDVFQQRLRSQHRGCGQEATHRLCRTQQAADLGVHGRIVRAPTVEHGLARFDRQIQQLIEERIDAGELTGG
jgi:hypothetical protein